jgi:hypothetical protein
MIEIESICLAKNTSVATIVDCQRDGDAHSELATRVRLDPDDISEGVNDASSLQSDPASRYAFSISANPSRSSEQHSC